MWREDWFVLERFANLPSFSESQYDREGKKKMVLAKDGDRIKLIHFGATGYGHNYSAAARKSFRARHKCDTAKDKQSARYWACRTLWGGAAGSTKSSPKSKQGKF